MGRADETTPTDDTVVVGVVAATGWAKGMATLTGVGGPGFGLLDGVVLQNNFLPRQKNWQMINNCTYKENETLALRKLIPAALAPPHPPTQHTPASLPFNKSTTIITVHG